LIPRSVRLRQGYGGTLPKRFARRRGLAHKNAATAERLLWGLAVVRPADEQDRKGERRADVAVVVMAPDRDAVGPETLGLRAIDFHRRHGDLVESGFQRDPHFQSVISGEKRISSVRFGRRRTRGGRSELGAAQRELPDALAVDAEFD